MPSRCIAPDLPPDAFDIKPWFKSLHQLIPEFYDLACHPRIVDRVVEAIGPDVIVWGVTVTERQPGQIHRWHVDVEHSEWRGVSVFLGLEGTASGSGLRFIDGSNQIGRMPQDHRVQPPEDVLELADPGILAHVCLSLRCRLVSMCFSMA